MTNQAAVELGKIRSRKKTIAVRKNGLRGGRPTNPVIRGFSRPIRRGIPAPSNTSGVYMLLKRRKVIYVGCSRDIAKRHKAHSWMDYTHFIFRRAGVFDMRGIELDFVLKLKPKHNAWEWYNNSAHGMCKNFPPKKRK